MSSVAPFPPEVLEGSTCHRFCCERNNPLNTMVREEGGIAAGAGAGVSLQLIEDSMPEQLEEELKELQPTERSQCRSKFVLKDCSHGGAGEKREEDRTIKEAVPE